MQYQTRLTCHGGHFLSGGPSDHQMTGCCMTRQTKRCVTLSIPPWYESPRVVQYTQTESDGRGPWTTRLTGSQFARDLVKIQQTIVERALEHVGKLTPSDPMETGCRGKCPSDCRLSVREGLSKYTRTIVEEGVENVGKRTPSDPMETGCRGKSPSDCRERLSKYTANYS